MTPPPNPTADVIPNDSGLSHVDHRAPGTRLQISFDNNEFTHSLCGEHDRHLTLIEQESGSTIVARGNLMAISGPSDAVETARLALETLYHKATRDQDIDPGDVRAALRMARDEADNNEDTLTIRTNKRHITPRTPNQKSLLHCLQRCGLTFALGPAGTGKTYLAVAYGVALLMAGKVERLVLSRPAVEAGERLGFLPGDMRDKVDPYLRPIYDALSDMLPDTQMTKRMANGNIEIAPLAFMRGRTLSHAFVILDEAQNATPVQMKMFLTRLGENAHMVVTGDPSQTDLPPGSVSGLCEAVQVLQHTQGVGIVTFDDSDVVRHPLVKRIVAAYQNFASSSQHRSR